MIDLWESLFRTVAALAIVLVLMGIYRIAVNQARNRHRFWRRRHTATRWSIPRLNVWTGSSARRTSTSTQ